MKKTKGSPKKRELGTTHVTFGSVLDDLGFDEETLGLFRQKVAVHDRLLKHIEKKGIKPKDLEKIFDEPQPRVSEFMRGKIAGMSLDKLARYANRLGVSVLATGEATTETKKTTTVKGVNEICWIGGDSGPVMEAKVRELVSASSRADKPLVVVHCANLLEGILEGEVFGFAAQALTGLNRDKEGLLEIADGGTLFLQEIEETSENLQKRLVEYLHTGVFVRVGDKKKKRANVRVILGSQVDLESLVKQSRVSTGLYSWAKDKVLRLSVPPRKRPLRETLDVTKDWLERLERDILSRALAKASGNRRQVARSNNWSAEIVDEKIGIYGLD